MIKGAEFTSVISKLGMSQVDAGVFLGFTTRNARRIAAGSAELSVPAEKLVRVMLECGLSRVMVDKIAAGTAATKKRRKAA